MPNAKKTGDATGELLTTVLRISGLYGPRDKQTIGELLKTVNMVATKNQVGPFKQLNEFVLVESAAKAFVQVSKALIDSPHRPKDMKVDGEAFSITHGGPMPFGFHAQGLEGRGDRNWNSAHPTAFQISLSLVLALVLLQVWLFWILTLETRRPKLGREHLWYLQGCWFSIQKARKRFGYKPICDSDEGIRRSMAWFRQNQRWDFM
jgi:sterol-4alpha-carboxylate 3-dehydrogenase (decarboxylating)